MNKNSVLHASFTNKQQLTVGGSTVQPVATECTAYCVDR